VTAEIYDQTINVLGEGPLWHPERGELFWFDIVSQKLYHRAGEDLRQWQFGEPVSAAGWIDRDNLLVASASALSRFDIESGDSEVVVPLEDDNPLTRSNDGRADPFGGFWIGTMGCAHEEKIGTIYRYYRGEVRALYSGITVPNAMCFSPDGGLAYFTDTMQGQVMRQKLDPADGWPLGEPDVFIDVRGEKFGADGSVIDTQGNFWNARYGGYSVARYSADGDLMDTLSLPTVYITCPAFGGADLSNLYVTSCCRNMSEEKRREQPDAGKTFVFETTAKGQAEHRVVL